MLLVAAPNCGADETGRAYVVGIEGMSCPQSCAPRVKESLQNVDGVDRVQVSFDDKNAVVTMEPGKSLTQEACDKAFGNSGYFVSSFDEKSDVADDESGS
jgi:copper chaperone CopZ